ncbi:MAG: endosialidase [Acetatifactor sp.]|nr:endosialidase [Acetatifactor sp.]MDE6699405.1 endosialidase [Acetatifactor sp.]MDE7270907.1 endosialidase [Acetatifactor sp.]
MAVVEELLRSEADGAISFGNHKLAKKAKVEDFKHEGDLLKVKTYNEITKLERNGMFLYESVPGTSVLNFREQADGVEFTVTGDADAQITVGLTDETEYEVFVDGRNTGKMKTGLGGKLSLSVELENADEVSVKVTQA